MKEIIDNFINQNTKIADFIDATSEQYQDGKDVLPAFTEKLIQAQFNAALGNSYADLLQLSNDERAYTQYSLEDVSRLYDSLIWLQPSNLENYVDAAYFEYSIQDNNEKARAIVDAGLEKIGQIQEELKRLIQTMKEVD